MRRLAWIPALVLIVAAWQAWIDLRSVPDYLAPALSDITSSLWDARSTFTSEAAVTAREMLTAAANLVRPGGRLVYSVCTLTNAETEAIDEWLADALPDLVAQPRPGEPWQPLGRGARLLPQTADTDGMYVVGLQSKRS